MSLTTSLTTFTKSLPRLPSFGSRLLRRWTAHRQRKAEHDALERLLAKADDHLLQDVGLDRSMGHRLLNETLFVAHQAWSHRQL